MRPPKTLAAIAMAVAVSGVRAAQEPDAPSPSPATLAIVRRDGVLIPFVTWTGKQWEAAWPVPRKESETPITFDALPKRWWGKPGPVAEWHAWTRDGRTHTLRASVPTWYLAHCQQGTGLRSSYSAAQPAPPPIVQPYPKDGVAASAAITFRPIAVLGESSSVWKAVLAALPPKIAEQEERLVQAYSKTGWKHPHAGGLQQVPVTLEALYRVPLGGGGQFVYYFEAVKRYAPKPDAPTGSVGRRGDLTCEVVTFLSGWFRAGNSDSAVTLGRVTPIMTTCDYAGADVMLPLAYIVWKGRPLWIAQFSGWGREWFTLVDVGPAGDTTIAFEASGGSCPVVG